MSRHTCHAIGCEKQVAPRMLMCMAHWRMVPKPMQLKVWATYRPGQEIDKHPSSEYMVAQRAAIKCVADKEGRNVPWGEGADPESGVHAGPGDRGPHPAGPHRPSGLEGGVALDPPRYTGGDPLYLARYRAGRVR